MGRRRFLRDKRQVKTVVHPFPSINFPLANISIKKFSEFLNSWWAGAIPDTNWTNYIVSEVSEHNIGEEVAASVFQSWRLSVL